MAYVSLRMCIFYYSEKYEFLTCLFEVCTLHNGNCKTFKVMYIYIYIEVDEHKA